VKRKFYSSIIRQFYSQKFFDYKWERYRRSLKQFSDEEAFNHAHYLQIVMINKQPCVVIIDNASIRVTLYKLIAPNLI